jgi:hypothetical protein
MLIDTKLELTKLRDENKALKEKIDQLYKDWLFDSNQYKILKEKYKT